MNPKRIVIDGKSYGGVDEMPADVRRNYEEAMRNMGSVNAAGVTKDSATDHLQNTPVINLSGGMKIVVDGQTYDSVEALPSEFRARYEQAMSTMDKNRNGIPDFVEGMVGASSETSQVRQMGNAYSSETPQRPSIISTSPDIAPERSSGWILAIGIGLLLFFCVFSAIGVWYFFLR